MKPKTKVILGVVGLIALFLFAANIPWRVTTHDSAGHVKLTFVDWRPLWVEASAFVPANDRPSSEIAMDVFAVEIVVLCIVGFVGWKLFGKKNT